LVTKAEAFPNLIEGRGQDSRRSHLQRNTEVLRSLPLENGAGKEQPKNPHQNKEHLAQGVGEAECYLQAENQEFSGWDTEGEEEIGFV